MYEGPPELRGVKRYSLSTNEWFVICCLLGNQNFLERSQRKPQLNRNELLTIELTFSLCFFFTSVKTKEKLLN